MNQLGLHTSEWMLISTFVLTLQHSHVHTYTRTLTRACTRTMYNEPSHLKTVADWKKDKHLNKHLNIIYRTVRR